MMGYKPLYSFADDGEGALPLDVLPMTRGDRRDGEVYVYNDKIRLAVNVALATNRPLLVRGPSGSGKSSLAENIALNFKWKYYSEIITSRTQAQDLLWKFDTLRRLSDAQVPGRLRDDIEYVDPGVLWWAFNPAAAQQRGVRHGLAVTQPQDPCIRGEAGSGAVVLLDEIDKADPDVPNNLLVPLGSLRFTVPYGPVEVEAQSPPLILITTNDERELPSAFIRRCVVLELDPISEEWLIKVAHAHFTDGDKKLEDELFRPIARKVLELTRQTEGLPGPSTAEYLDTLHACRTLNIRPPNAPGDRGSFAWQTLTSITLVKPRLPGSIQS